MSNDVGKKKSGVMKLIFIVWAAIAVITPICVYGLIGADRVHGDTFWEYMFHWDYTGAEFFDFLGATMVCGLAFALLMIWQLGKVPNPKSHLQTAAFVLLFASQLLMPVIYWHGTSGVARTSGIAYRVGGYLYYYFAYGWQLDDYSLLYGGLELYDTQQIVLHLAAAVFMLLCAVWRKRRYGKLGFASIAAVFMALAALDAFVFGVIAAELYTSFEALLMAAGDCLLSLVPAAALLLLSLNKGFTSEEEFAAAREAKKTPAPADAHGAPQSFEPRTEPRLIYCKKCGTRFDVSCGNACPQCGCVNNIKELNV